MAIYYNGLTLEIDSIQEFSRVPVYHHTKYLYTRHTLRCRCIYNPNATAYAYANVPGLIVEDRAGVGLFGGATVANLNAAKNQGRAGSLTDTQVRHALMTPRRLLIYTTEALPGQATVELLVSPARRPDAGGGVYFYTEDASRGPFPLCANIVKRHANKTLEIDFGIRTDLNECHLFSITPTPLIGHHWSMQRKVDQDFFSTRIIQGEAVFRMDRMAQLTARADDFITWLAHPVPPGFQRIGSEVMPSEDGTKVNYVLVDKEKPFTLSSVVRNWGVTRIEAYLKSGYSHMGWERWATEASLLVANALDSINVDPVHDASMLNALSLRGTMLAIRALPVTRTALVCKVWGNRNATRQNLLKVAYGIFSNLINANDFAASTSNASVVEDLVGKYVEATIEVERGPFNTSYQVGGVATIVDLFNGMAPAEEIAGITTSALGSNPFPPGDGVVRGTYTAALVSQAIAGSCTVLTEPSEPGQFANRSPDV